MRVPLAQAPAVSRTGLSPPSPTLHSTGKAPKCAGPRPSALPASPGSRYRATPRDSAAPCGRQVCASLPPRLSRARSSRYVARPRPRPPLPGCSQHPAFSARGAARPRARVSGDSMWARATESGGCAGCTIGADQPGERALRGWESPRNFPTSGALAFKTRPWTQKLTVVGTLRVQAVSPQ